MQVIGPIAGWGLPDGYGYDDETDTIRTMDGEVMTDPSKYWEVDEIEVVAPGYQAGSQQPETVERATNDVVSYAWIKPDAYLAATTAWAVRLAGHLYNVTAVDAFPVGSAEPAIYRVTLERRRENRAIWTGWEQAWRPR